MTPENDITKDMTAVEAANLLAKLEDGNRAAWLSTREESWHSAKYQARFQNAADVDGVFRDVMRETVENGMRQPRGHQQDALRLTVILAGRTPDP